MLHLKVQMKCGWVGNVLPFCLCSFALSFLWSSEGVFSKDRMPRMERGISVICATWCMVSGGRGAHQENKVLYFLERHLKSWNYFFQSAQPSAFIAVTEQRTISCLHHWMQMFLPFDYNRRMISSPTPGRMIDECLITAGTCDAHRTISFPINVSIDTDTICSSSPYALTIC